jgi:hypothetical protein
MDQISILGVELWMANQTHIKLGSFSFTKKWITLMGFEVCLKIG